MSTLTAIQTKALRDIEATGTDGLPTVRDGRKTINGNCEYVLRGSYGKTTALVKLRDHGFVRTVRTRHGSTYAEHDMRYHLTDAGRAILGAAR